MYYCQLYADCQITYQPVAIASKLKFYFIRVLRSSSSYVKLAHDMKCKCHYDLSDIKGGTQRVSENRMPRRMFGSKRDESV
jgi:hypothetical protein